MGVIPIMRHDLREHLRLELYARRISITELARELGMNRVTISRMLNGQIEGRFEVWEKIAKKAGKHFELVDDA